MSDTLTTKQVAHMLGVGTSTVIRMVHRGDLVGWKKTPATNSPMRITRESVQAVLNQRRVSPQPEPA